MKIALVSAYDMTRSGGVQSYVLFLAKYFKKMGHEAVIIGPGEDKAKKPDNTILVGNLLNISFGGTRPDISWITGKQATNLKSYLNNSGFDVIHLHEPAVPFLTAQALDSITNKKILRVGTVYATIPQTPVGKITQLAASLRMPPILKKLDIITTISNAPLSFLEKIAKKNVQIVPCGIDTYTFKPSNKPFKKFNDKKLNILFFGRLDKRKGAIYLLKAFRKLKSSKNNTRLIIGGKGEQLDNIINYTRRHNIRDVVFLGYVKEKQKSAVFASADIFCSPAIYGESFGIVLLEAMASGKPVVATDIKGYKSVIQGRGSDLLVSPKNSTELATKLLMLTQEKELRKDFGIWSRKEALKYSWHKIATQMLKLYKEAIKSR